MPPQTMQRKKLPTGRFKYGCAWSEGSTLHTLDRIGVQFWKPQQYIFDHQSTLQSESNGDEYIALAGRLWPDGDPYQLVLVELYVVRREPDLVVMKPHGWFVREFAPENG